jgi:hypothetical protein
LAWGGSLNKDGSSYLRKIREADRVVKFLESIREELKPQESKKVYEVIEIISNYISKNSESES